MALRDENISTNISKVTDGTPPVGMDFSAMTLEEQAAAGDETRVTRPVGGG